MKLGFSQQEIIGTAKSLGLPTDGFIQRRIARAYDLVESNKVSKIDDGIFRVRSQYEPDKSYIVNLNHGEPSCDCPDGERTINCKHRIASLLYMQKLGKASCVVEGVVERIAPSIAESPLRASVNSRSQAITIIKTTDGEALDYWRRCWLIVQGNSRPMVYEERDRSLFCNCGAHYEDCEHKQLVIKAVTVERAVALPRLKEFTEKRIVTECGSGRAKEIQERLNSQNDNGNGAEKAPSQTMSLDIRDPFQQSEQFDIDQIEGRLNGELVHKLSNGEYVISYRGIMTLAKKHSIEFDEVSLNDKTVIAKAKNGNERISGKPIYDNATGGFFTADNHHTALELAKRNAARQLLPLPEIKAVEKKAQLEAEFDWQKAKAKCVELVGEANVSIIIHDLTQAGKLRQDNPSHYDRTEWLMIYDACQKDAQVPRDPKSLNRWSYNSVEFLERCKRAMRSTTPSPAIAGCDALTRRLLLVRENKDAVEACGRLVEALTPREQPLQNGNGDNRKLMMDKKLRTWLVEADGTKKPISCREIAEQFDSYEKGIIRRLRAGIDSGADISTVELN